MRPYGQSGRQPPPVGALGRVMVNKRLVNLLGAWAVSNAVLWAWAVTIATVTYQLAGVPAVALALVSRLLPGAVIAPFATVLASHKDDAFGLVASASVRVAAMLGATALLATEGPLELLYVTVALEGIGSGPMQALHNRLLPLKVRLPDELALSNSLTELFRATGLLVGPGLAAVVLFFQGPVWVTGLCGGLLLATLPLLYWTQRAVAKPAGKLLVPQLVQLREGAIHAFTDKTTAILVATFVLCGVVTGAVQVFVTVIAIDTAGWGMPGPSIMLGLIGFGGLVGGLLSIVLLGRMDLSATLACGLFAIGLALVALGSFSTAMTIVVSSIIGGAALAVALISQSTLFHRGVALPLQAAVFGLSALLHVLGIAVGGVLGSGLIESVGIASALVAAGISLCLVAGVVWMLVKPLTAGFVSRPRELQILRQSRLLNTLAIGPSEQVAGCLQLHIAAPGELIIKQGEPGDEAYLIGCGHVTVTVDGKKIAELKDGDVFGEIALLHDVSRTATVVAATQTELWRLNRHAFLSAVTATPECHQLLTSVAKQRLEEVARTTR